MGSEKREMPPQVAPAITQVSEYDNWSAFLTSGVIVLALLVAILFGIWLSASEQQAFHRSGVVIPGQEYVSDQQSSVDLAEPGFSELPEARTPEMKEAMLAVTKVATNVAASNVLLQGEQTDGEGIFGGGEGDRRTPGPIVTNEWERWKIEYNPECREDYFEMLDQFGVYLGAVSQSANRIQFLKNLADDVPEVIEGTRSSEIAKNVYFRNLRSKLRDWDRAKLRRASVDLEDTIIVQFYPEPICQVLRELEARQLESDGRTLDQVRNIRFGCRKTGDQFEYFVEQITYLTGR